MSYIDIDNYDPNSHTLRCAINSIRVKHGPSMSSLTHLCGTIKLKTYSVS